MVDSRRHSASPIRVVGALVGQVALATMLAACGTPDAPPAINPPSATSQEPDDTTAATPPSDSTLAATTTVYRPPPLPDPSPPLPSPGDNRVYVLGDSVILGAQATLPAALVGWKTTFDAQESRLIDQGLEVLRARKARYDEEQQKAHEQAAALAVLSGQPPPPAPEPASLADVLGRVVVISLCTNYSAGSGFGYWIDRYMQLLSSIERVVWVTCREWSPGQVEANQAIREAASRYKTMIIADWASFGPVPGYTYDDGIHLTTEGRKVLADLVARAVGPAPLNTR